MFCLKVKINLYLCLGFLLTNGVRKAATFPSHNFSTCNCILLQSCGTFNTFIDNSSDDVHIKSVIQNAFCFFDGFNIFVCCSDNVGNKRNVKKRHNLDYLDELTGLNCPPSFGNEYNYDEYLRTRKIEANGNGVNSHDHTTPEVFDEFNPFGQFYENWHHPHHQQHNHYHHHNNQVSFFPHTHTHRHNHDDYLLKSVTQRPAKEHKSCGILPPVLGNGMEIYPWITRLAYLNTTSRTIRYRCMATIISDQHVLTAAHCVDQLVTDLRLIYARIGDDTNFDDYQILETTVHPNYNEPLFNNDVAILKLAITSQNKDSLKQICLPKNITNTLSGEMGVVAGWSSSGISEIKSSAVRYITLPIMNNTECAIRYAKYSENFESGIVITPTEFCAKAQALNDVCEGDSGGPFMERSNSGRYTLLGIVAFGPKTNCGQSNLPGVYMRVSSYIDWIKRSI